MTVPSTRRLASTLAVTLVAACSGGGSETTSSASTTAPPATTATTAAPPVRDDFDEFDWVTPEELADPSRDRLCAEAADPDAAADTTNIDCRIEGVAFAEAAPRADDEPVDLVVLTYNLERGFEVDAQLAWLAEDGPPDPDVLLLQEADRGCARTGYRNIAAEFARAIGGYSVFATEFVELPGDRGRAGPYDPPLCEHGNAIVARYPIGNVRQVRHAANTSWYTPPGTPSPDEPRLGGRIAVAADLLVGERIVRIYSLHLESRVDALDVRDAQAAEIADDAAAVRGPVVVGGDLNSYGYAGDLESGNRSDGAAAAFLSAGFADGHAGVAQAERHSSFDPVPLVIDLLFVRGADTATPGRCPPERCGDLSDHLPVWATVVLPSTSRETGADLTLVSLNVLHGLVCTDGDHCDAPHRIELLAQQIEQAGCPDVVGLQEVAPWIHLLVLAVQPTLCDGAYEIVFPDPQGDYVDVELVLARVPVRVAERVTLAGGFRRALLVRLDAEAGPVDLVVTHTGTGADNLGQGGQPCDAAACTPPCDPAGTVLECEIEQVRDLATTEPTPRRVAAIVAGDLNLVPEAPPMRILYDAGFIDSHLESGNAECDGDTGYGCTGGRDDTRVETLQDPAAVNGERIDYVLVAPGRTCDARYDPPSDDDSDGVGTGLFAAEPAAADAPGGFAWVSDHIGTTLDFSCA